MATASVLLDIRANTNRALNDFKKFSSQLDNKFLISGLKLDVVRSALSQINREFQRSIGEQGLQAGESLRAAQNQAALLTQTFKGFSSAASIDMAEQFSSAFSQIAVTAGGTAKDIQKALAATPFISTNLSKDLRDQLAGGIMAFQRDFRRAGLSDDIGAVIRQFLAGQISAGELIESGEAGKSFIGSQLAQLSGGNISLITNAEQRSRVALELVSDPTFNKRLQEMAKRAYGFRGIIEDLNTYLFNPEAGIFGSLRQVTMGVRDKTTILDETNKLVESVFGRQGLFVNFFRQIGKIFGIEDPLKVVIIGIRFITRQFEALNRFVQSEQVQGLVKKIQEAFNTVKEFATSLYSQVMQDLDDPNSILGQVRGIGTSVVDFFKSIFETVSAGDWDSGKITTSIKEVGESVRGFIRKLGEDFRTLDLGKQGKFLGDVLGTLVEEVAKTLGAVISEGIKTVFSGKGLALLGGALEIIRKGLTGFFTEIFGSGGGSVLGAIGTAGIAAAFGKKVLVGIMGFAASLIAALPGGQVINRLIGQGSRSALRNVATRIGGPGLAERLTGRSSDGNLLDRRLEGGPGGFQSQVLSLMRRIAACVCGPGRLGGGRDIDIDADTPEARRERARTRRGPTGPGMPSSPRAGDRRLITPVTQYNRPISPARPVGSYGFPLDAMDAPYADARRRRGNFLTREFRNIYDTGADSAVPGYIDRSGGNVAARFNRRYGGGGTRAVLGRGFRGFGKGALIAGGIAGGIALLGGGNAQASEIDPMTGEPIQPKVGAGEAFGRVGMGAAEGALTGATIGSIIPGIGTGLGAAIGGAIGAAAQLFDKGVRDAIGKFISSTASNLMRMGGDLVNGLKKNVLGAFDAIKNFAGGIDWKSVLINALIPGGSATIQGLQGIAQFASKLNIFDAIKAGIDSVNGFVGKILDGFRGNPATGWLFRRLGGPVVRGQSYYVGEEGPELFTPTQNGTISSNRELMSLRSSGSGSSVSANFNIAINVNGNMAPGDAEALRGPVLRIIEEAWASATQGTISRGALV